MNEQFINLNSDYVKEKSKSWLRAVLVGDNLITTLDGWICYNVSKYFADEIDRKDLIRYVVDILNICIDIKEGGKETFIKIPLPKDTFIAKNTIID